MKDTLEEAVELHMKAKERMAKGNFNLRKWNSNSSKFMEVIHEKSDETPGDIDEENPSSELPTINFASALAKLMVGNSDEIVMDKEHKILGVAWNTELDSISIKFKAVADLGNSLEFTKRKVLKITAKLFYLLGLASLYSRSYYSKNYVPHPVIGIKNCQINTVH